MKNFDWSSFTVKIAVKSDLKTMYNAWTKQHELEKWFLSKALFHDAEQQELEENTAVQPSLSYAWNWYLYDQTEYGTIAAANGTDHLQFTFAGDCVVDVNLSQQGDHAVVSLTQSNIPTDDESKINYRLGCHSGWSFFLVNLKSVYENGFDLRNKNPEFKGMLNC